MHAAAAAGCLLLFGIALAWLVIDPQQAHGTTKLFIARYALLLPGLWLLLTAGSGRSSAAGWRLPGFKWLAIFYLISAIALGWGVYPVPATADEHAYLFQASALRQGAWAAPAPVDELVHNLRKNEFFFVHHVIADGLWFGKYPPGWPAALALWQSVGPAWLLNPLLGLMLLWLTRRVALLLWDETAARLCGWVLLLSPMFLFNVVGFNSHALCGVFIAGAVLFGLRGWRTARWGPFVIMFALLGGAFAVRPYTALLTGLALGGLPILALARQPRRLIAALLLGGLLLIPGAAFLAAQHKALTGSYFLSPYAQYRGGDRIHELSTEGATIWANLKRATAPSLAQFDNASAPFLVLLALAALLRRGSRDRRPWLLAALAGTPILGYVAMTERSDSLVGERYYFEGWLMAAVLAAWGCRLCIERWRPSWRQMQWAGAVVIGAQLVLTGMFAVRVHARVSPHQRLEEAVKRTPLDRFVAFMRADLGFQPDDHNANTATWRTDRVFYLADPGAGARRAAACRLGRQAWAVYSYDSAAGEVRIVELVRQAACPAGQPPLSGP